MMAAPIWCSRQRRRLPIPSRTALRVLRSIARCGILPADGGWRDERPGGDTDDERCGTPKSRLSADGRRFYADGCHAAASHVQFYAGHTGGYVAATDSTNGATNSDFGEPANGIEFMANWLPGEIQIVDASTGQSSGEVRPTSAPALSTTPASRTTAPTRLSPLPMRPAT